MNKLHHHALALALALLSLTALRVASQDTGYVRDEAAYFEASQRIRSWLEALVQDPKKAMRARDRTFRYNHEHPVGIKGLAALTISDPDQTSSTSGQAMRWPAHVLSAFCVYLLAYVGMVRYGPAIGAFCGLAFLSLPRVFYHAQLHCFDLPIACAALCVSLLFVRLLARPSLARALALGAGWGLALSVKHNALLFPLFLTIPWAWSCADRSWPKDRLRTTLGLGALALALGALLFFLLWPWLWSDPLGRWLDYIRFHREHSYYNMAYLGHNYNQPPLPWSYPWVLTAVTWPLSWLLLLLASLALGITTRRQGPVTLNTRVELVMGLAPLLLIGLPSVPIFGGTKHWITAYPFLCLLMGRGLHALSERMQLRPLPLALGLLVLLSPAVVDNLRSHPNQLAQYASWFGGPRAAARAGMGRGFWGGLCAAQALALPEHGATLFSHDLHPALLGAYQSPPHDLELEWRRRSKAQWGLHFYEDHMLIDELWTQRAGFGRSPHWVCTLDDVPLMSVYKKPARGEP